MGKFKEKNIEAQEEEMRDMKLFIIELVFFGLPAIAITLVAMWLIVRAGL